MSKDAHEVYEITLSAYAKQLEPARLSRLIAPSLGEISTHLSPAQSFYFKPYYEALWAMFSPQVFPD